MEEQIYQVSEETWARVLGLRITKRAGGETNAEEPSDPLTGRVEISGGWRGTLLLSCSAALARRAAGIVFSCPVEEVEPSQLGDVLGELTNIIGGNVKAILPGPSQLSSPVVTEETDRGVAGVSGQLVSRVELDCEGAPVSVALYSRQEAD